MNKNILAIALFLLSFFASFTIAAQDKKVRQIDSLIERAYDLGLFNGNLLVAEQDNIIYKASMGFAEAANKNRLNDQYRFNIGEITSEFTAVALMILANEGKFKLEDKLTKFFTELPAWGAKISIRNIIQQNSGVPDIGVEGMDSLKRLKLLDFEPGAKYQNTSGNLFLQRLLIEKTSGVAYPAFIEKRILKSAGLTAVQMDPTTKDPLIARSYNNEQKEDALTMPLTGTAYLTIDDLFKWSESLNQFNILKPAALRVLLTAADKDKSGPFGKATMQGDQLITHVHSSISGNYQTLLAVNTLKGRTVVLMSNNKNIDLHDLNTAIQSILEEKTFVMPKKSIFQKIEKQLGALNGQQIVAFYEYLKIHNANDYNFDHESELNSIGYFLLEKGRFEDAITVFGHNTKFFARSGPAFYGLGKAYDKKGDKKAALLNYKKSLMLTPSNKEAKERIAVLEKPVIEKK